MKRIIAFVLVLMMIMPSGVVNVYAQDSDVLVTSPSAILMEASTGTVIYEKNADDVLRPASVTKIMTLLLIFDALDEGRISKEDIVTVSEHAASMGGSQVFLEPMETQTVETMIKCICVASANDASVAMAEFVCGSEPQFVQKMNERAAGLGMTNTHFENCCGLDADGHMTTARDIAVMSRELITKHPSIHEYSMIWMDTITHVTRRGESEFGLSNTNKLIKQYQWATGLKTGSTSLAKCCLSATAKKDGVELIAVIMAAPNSKTRFADAVTLLNYGFGACRLYKDENPPELLDVPVRNGVQPYVAAEYAKIFECLFTDDTDISQITSRTELSETIQAPVEKGQALGQLLYMSGENVIGSVDIVASEDVRRAGYADYIKIGFVKYFSID